MNKLETKYCCFGFNFISKAKSARFGAVF